MLVLVPSTLLAGLLAAAPLSPTASADTKQGPPSYAFLRSLGPLVHARGLSRGDAAGGAALGQLDTADYEAPFAGALASAGLALTPAAQARGQAYPELFCLWDQHLDTVRDDDVSTHCTLYVYLLPARPAAAPRGEPGWELSVTRMVDDGSSSTAQVRDGFVARAAQALAADLKAARSLSATGH